MREIKRKHNVMDDIFIARRLITDNTGKFVATSYKKFQVAIAHAKMCRPRIGKTLKSPRSTQGMTSDGSFLFGRASHVESEVASLLLNIGYELRKHNSMSSNLLHHLSTP